MTGLNLWESDELTDEQLRDIVTKLEQDFPEIADGLRHVLRHGGKPAALAATIPALFSEDAYDFWRNMGVHIEETGDYYSPIPQIDTLDTDLWDGPSEIFADMEIDASSQLTRFSEFESQYKEEYDQFPIVPPSEEYDGYYSRNLFFETIDAEIAYSIVRDRSPNRIIEIGGGYSTKVIEAAREQNETDSEHIVIDPFPSRRLEGISSVSILEMKVQDIPLDFFKSLREDDILFIDSTHVVKIGSDVVYEYLEVLPRLEDGVLVHLHDVFLPYEYPETWIKDWRLFFNEQYLLYGLMLGNSRYEVLWTSYFMHRDYSDRLAKAIENYGELRHAYDLNPHGLPSSFWLQVRRRSAE
ncbi:hypothetical protein A6E15_07610 [Natrinema saccharevitans]|uniref:Methyltransferase n=1 Tax=Natrinema saccharevitans TaxID=301967 RepID=A0A1S8AVH6_9EURY|nr:class I SAM-dependent methyltransferase [Natrinema saccharevitans]OLZ40863.1 hypothetical protein A6E15_07610 [Natrinema saccharevitans]